MKKVFAYVFPACAGMNRYAAGQCGTAPRVPRVRGDEPMLNASVRVDLGCSPRARG